MMRIRAGALAALLSLWLVACSTAPRPATPALWRVEDPAGHAGWLFGTIHSAPEPIDWQTPVVKRALGRAGIIMVEVGNLADEADVAAVFAALARAPAMPPLSARVDAADRPALAALLERGGYRDGDFATLDTWAAALTLARTGEDPRAARNGVDRAVIALAGSRPVVELEGARRQLGLFDSLSEPEQRDLLHAVIEEATAPSRHLDEKWRAGDMAAIAVETRSGLLADPQLREVLFTGRNRRWARRIGAAITAGQRPFVAVGAAHMAGPDGLPAMLARAGYTVTRIDRGARP